MEGFSKIDEGADWVGQEIDWEPTVEMWRFYQSGQFVHYSGMMTDWSEHIGTFSGWPSQWDSEDNRMVLLDIKEVMLRLTEVFEFASRLTFTHAGDEQMHLEVAIVGIENYLLRVSSTSQADFFRKMVSPESRIPFEFELHKFELVSNAKELALRPAAELFQRFSWDPGVGVLRDIQYELLNPTPSEQRWT